MIYAIIFIVVVAALVAHYLTSKVTYLIIYSAVVEGKREYYNTRYEVSVRHGIPTDQEFKDYLSHILNGCESLKIIDIHKLT